MSTLSRPTRTSLLKFRHRFPRSRTRVAPTRSYTCRNPTPFSLRVSRPLGFLRGECTAESPLLAGSSSDWSNRLSLPFGPLNRNEIGLSSRVLTSGSSRGISTLMTSLSELGLELRSGVRGIVKHNVAAHAHLFGARVIALITLLLV